MKKMILCLIILNEFCERFCFYGLKALLFTFLRNDLMFSARKSTFIVHTFVSMCYFLPILGGIISDVILGKYKTILYLSAVYLVGTLFLTYSSLITGINSASTMYPVAFLYLGLFFIAIGTGGIKPCVAAFGGDQVADDENNKNNISNFFNYFYFAINLGSMISTFILPVISNFPCLNKSSCYSYSFGLSSALLLSSIILFTLGSKYYIKKKPESKDFLETIKKLFKDIYYYTFKFKNQEFKPKKELSNEAATKAEIKEKEMSPVEILYLEEQENTKKFLNLLKILLPISCFWMLYDQQSSTWIEQGTKMNNFSTVLEQKINIIPSQMQTFNSIFILLFIPLFTKIIYPLIELSGRTFTPVKKMTVGLFLASLSFYVSAFLDYYIHFYSTFNIKISILWQLPQYLILTAGEILLNMTGLEFAYSEAPENMKSLILSAWLLTVTLGNLVVILYSSIDFLRFFDIKFATTLNFIIYGTLGSIAGVYMLHLEKDIKEKSI